MLQILTFIGIIFCPRFTLGCVLIYFGHTFLGIFAIILSIITIFYNSEKSNS